ncbi:MAG TPA: hypothetical protein ENK91_02765 [Bacteroidetes bacterium]|nr:hypothetical protein [Bacteroidota bacterium]
MTFHPSENYSTIQQQTTNNEQYKSHHSILSISIINYSIIIISPLRGSVSAYSIWFNGLTPRCYNHFIPSGFFTFNNKQKTKNNIPSFHHSKQKTKNNKQQINEQFAK